MSYYFQSSFAFLLGILMLAATNARAQFGLHLQFLPGQAAAQLVQPAYLAGQQTFQHGQLGTEGNFWLGSNAITLDGILQDGNHISEASKNQIIGQLGRRSSQLHAGARWGLHANVKALNQNWQLSFRQHIGLALGINDSSTAGLILRGNAPYAGQSLSDEDVFFRMARYNEYGLATAFQLKGFQVGIRLKALQGLRGTFLDEVNYTFFTADDGTSIEVQAQYDLRQSRAEDPYGWGAGIDLGAIFTLNQQWRMQASLRNLGFIRWQGIQMAHAIEVDYQGSEAGNILGDDLGTGDYFDSDTLQKLLVPDTLHTSFTTGLPASIQLGLSYQFDPKTSFHASLHQSLSRNAPTARTPLLNLAVHHQLVQPLLIGANVYAGGMEGFGMGLVAAANFNLAEKVQIGAHGILDNALGAIAPGQSKGLGLQAGLHIGW
ncbi:MAG: hypothetical protein D6730_07570 [Bacteroidetes bacterium]|nr:MAG: hypothetical protein D6730_07570 [Bacteroidota bacterium]